MRSPAWHRHLRGLRSRIRRRIRSREKVTLPHLRLILEHHGTAPAQRQLLQRLYMGRGKKQPAGHRPWRPSTTGSEGWQDDHHGQHGGGWALWQGSWKASPRAQPRQPRAAQNEFPPYDEGWQQAAGVMDVSTSTSLPRTRPTSTPGGGLVHDVQSAINQARKLETRLQKLQKEALQKGRSWDAWVLRMRTSYSRESERHQSEQRRLAAEIREVEELTMAAYLQVQDAAFKQQRASQEAVPPPLEWESAMEVEPTPADLPTRQELERMLRIVTARQTGQSTPPRPTGAAPLTPPGTARDFQMDVSPGPPVTSDGYPTPPSTPAPHSASGIGVPPDPRAPAAPELPSRGQSALAAKLSEKRRSMRHAMAPFGLGKTAPAPESHTEGTNTAETARPTDGTLIDDDPDELAGISPGFGSLE